MTTTETRRVMLGLHTTMTCTQPDCRECQQVRALLGNLNGRHEQQGTNVWYCPERRTPVQINDGRDTGCPAYAERVCPVCGQTATPNPIR